MDLEETLFTNVYKVDLIAEYNGNLTEDLILHWGISKKNPGDWTSPDDRYLPKDTVRFTDGKACQTKFAIDSRTPNMRSIFLKFWWKEDMEPPVKSMSYVFLEKTRNWWHNNNSRNYMVKFEQLSATPS